MKKLKINNLDIELNINVIGKFLDKIEYPILIFDFEAFRNLLHKKKNNSYAHYFEKIFSITLLIIGLLPTFTCGGNNDTEWIHQCFSNWTAMSCVYSKFERKQMY
ncbi:hypothetical protein [Spiroplasma ixodetis]|uniref:Transposase n=1 Tax=Spiroplasma ixodetis TaxID=2141 RepID=A0ABN7BWW3_9MOLU